MYTSTWMYPHSLGTKMITFPHLQFRLRLFSPSKPKCPLALHSHSIQSTIFSHSIFLLFEIIPAFTHLPSLADFPTFVKWDAMYLALDPRWVNTKLVRNQWIFNDQIHINFPQTSPNNVFQLFYLPLIISTLPVNVLNLSLFKLQLNLLSLLSHSLRRKKPSNLSSLNSFSNASMYSFNLFSLHSTSEELSFLFLLIHIPSYLISLNLWMYMCLPLPLGFTVQPNNFQMWLLKNND